MVLCCAPKPPPWTVPGAGLRGWGAQQTTAASDPWAQAGSIAMSPGGNLLVAASDNGGVAVVAPGGLVTSFIPTGNRPEHIIVRNQFAFVSNRQSRSVTQIDTGTLQVVRQIAVGAEPMGMDTTSDGTLLVACAMSGTIQAVDTTDGSTRWTLPVHEEVRAVAVATNGTALAPSYRSAFVHVIDVQSGVEKSGIDVSLTDFPTYEVRGLESILINPITGTVLLPHTESRAGPVAPFVSGTSTVASGYSQPTPIGPQGGPVSSGTPSAPITVSALTRLNSSNGLLSSTPLQFVNQGVAGPKISALDPLAQVLYVVGSLSDSVTTQSPEPSGGFEPEVVRVGAGPTGIVTADGGLAWVYNAFDHSITELGRPNGTSWRCARCRTSCRRH
jgi:YVTN family beta-propeller protein